MMDAAPASIAVVVVVEVRNAWKCKQAADGMTAQNLETIIWPLLCQHGHGPLQAGSGNLIAPGVP